jgi:hypothetical protein
LENVLKIIEKDDVLSISELWKKMYKFEITDNLGAIFSVAFRICIQNTMQFDRTKGTFLVKIGKIMVKIKGKRWERFLKITRFGNFLQANLGIFQRNRIKGMVN